MQLDFESADLIAALRVQDALVQFPALQGDSVEQTALTLGEADKIDAATARYLVRNAHRFLMLPAPQYFGAKWHVAANAVSDPTIPFAAMSSAPPT